MDGHQEADVAVTRAWGLGGLQPGCGGRAASLHNSVWLLKGKPSQK